MLRFITLVCAAMLAASGAVSAQPRFAEERYIVVLKATADAPDGMAAELRARVGGRVGYVYTRALRGFSIVTSPVAAEILARDPRVAYVERDLPMSIDAQTTPTGIRRVFAAANGNLMIDGVDDYRVDADVAVLDTGIDYQHPDLNVVGGVDCTYYTGWLFNRTYYCNDSAPGEDDHYHGTHVAGTIGAIDNGLGVVGVAPGVRLWAVKVLNAQGSGYTSGIIAGIDWVVARGDIEVLNMSLGGAGVSAAYKDAIDAAVAAGVVVVVAAGNSNADARNYSPAYVPSAITVSALADFDGLAGGLASPTCRADQDDTLADFSNWGPAIDIAAPGVCILSTAPTGQGGYATISGTSMAAPHVAGAAALLASGANAPSNAAGVAAIRNTLVAHGNYDWVDDSGDGVQEALLDVGAFSAAMIPSGGDPGPDPDPDPDPENQAPTANFSFDCDYLQCAFVDQSSDSDGSVVAWSWTFGDGGSSSARNPSRTYAAAGSYTVSLTATDDDGASASVSKTVTVEAEPVANGISLTATGSFFANRNVADLAWSGAGTSRVDVYRNGVRLRSVMNNGSYQDNLRRATGTFTYRICEQNSTICSNESSVTF